MMGFIICICVFLIFIAYRFINVSFAGIKMRNNNLKEEVGRLNRQLDLLSEKELKASREAAIVHKAKGKILSLMSHEIRTPMNGVIGMATLLAETELNSEQRDYTDHIIDCSKTLLTNVNEILVNDMLDFSKVDVENGELIKKNFNLQNCIEEVLDMFAGKAAENGIDLIYQIEENVPLQITGDYKKLQQILINLTENAVRHTSKGEVLIGVTHLPETAEKELTLKFTIRDTGTGIPQEKLQDLFKPILPADYSTKTKAISEGFGLLICKRLTELMGGEIIIENNSDNGCTFGFSILTKECGQVLRDFGNNKMEPFEGKQVLIVDDNITSNKVLCSQIEQWKLIPVVAYSARQALEVLSQISVDIIIADLLMPETDGIEFSKSIRSLFPKMPIVLLNTVNDDRYKLHPELFGAIINKPVKHDKLFDTVLNEFRHIYASPNNTGLRSIPDNFSKLYPLRILVAEDNHVNQKWIKKILNKTGYECEIADNGKIVLEKVSHDNFDLILMDVQMPEMDGMEATRMIRVCLETQPVIIAMTANVMQGDREECMQSGMDDYISKPVALPELLGMLEKWALSIKEKKDRLKSTPAL